MATKWHKDHKNPISIDMFGGIKSISFFICSFDAVRAICINYSYSVQDNPRTSRFGPIRYASTLDIAQVYFQCDQTPTNDETVK